MVEPPWYRGALTTSLPLHLECDPDEAQAAFDEPLPLTGADGAWSVLEGRAGELLGIERRGQTWRARVKLPRWLLSLYKGEQLAIRLGYDFVRQRLKKPILVSTGRQVSADAALACFVKNYGLEELATMASDSEFLDSLVQSLPAAQRAGARQRLAKLTGQLPSQQAYNGSGNGTRADQAVVNAALASTSLGRSILAERGVTVQDASFAEGGRTADRQVVDSALETTPLGRTIVAERRARRG